MEEVGVRRSHTAPTIPKMDQAMKGRQKGVICGTDVGLVARAVSFEDC